MYSNESKKMEILTRLVKEGHITLDEAFELADNSDDKYLGPINPQPQIMPPFISTPYQPSILPNSPWFGINHPTTGEYLGSTFNITSSNR